MGKLFTSESVTEGHPDKIADQISDAILDELIRQDPYSRVAAETTVATGIALIVGEITTKAYVDIAKIARDTIEEIGKVKISEGLELTDSIAIPDGTLSEGMKTAPMSEKPEAEASEEDEGFGGEDSYEPQENGAEEEIIDYALPEVVPEGIGVDGGVPDGGGLDGSDN